MLKSKVVLMASSMLSHDLAFSFSSIFNLVSSLFAVFLNLRKVPIFITFTDILISLRFLFYGLSPFTIDLDDQTTVNFWVTNHRRDNKPNLVMIHGSGSAARWQFVHQVGSLSQDFNLFVPDLLFFGKSFTRRKERSDVFQAKCVMEGLKRLGLDRFSVYGISYGGFVGFWMAEMYPEMVEKLVIVSCGMVYSEEQKEEHIKKIGRKVQDVLVPENPDDLRFLVKLSVHKADPLKWAPEFIIREFIEVMSKTHRREKQELVEHLLQRKGDSELPTLTQETLIVWGDQDKLFPLHLAHQLQRHLGPRSKVEIIKDAGHAVNVDAPDILNDLIKSFI